MGTQISPVIRLEKEDNVVVARHDIPAGTKLLQEGITTLQAVPAGHKVATRLIRKGEAVLKYNTVIGYAAEDIAPGTWMHSHNIRFDEVDKDYAFSRDYRPVELIPEGQRATFMGIVRADGRVAARNIIAIPVAGNCAATVARKIAMYFDEERMKAYPNVDAVVPFITGIGCGMEMTGEPMDLLRRTISGHVANPNVAGALANVLEKSLGGAKKGGSTPVNAVYRYAERVTEKGLVIMDTPGYDPMSVTGEFAGGATLCAFTTGRGSCFGAVHCPTVKLASNTEMYERMKEDMDINCGQIIDGEKTIEEMGDIIFDKLLAVASGEKSRSEELGVGYDEYVPWPLGVMA